MQSIQTTRQRGSKVKRIVAWKIPRHFSDILKTFLGTVFEVGAQRLEVYSANHVKAPIQWLRAARDNGKQAEEIMNLISCRSD